MKQYYIIEEEAKKGPFSLDKLIEMGLPENTLVWKKGLEGWIPLKDLSEYKQNIPPPIPSRIQIEKENEVAEEKKSPDDIEYTHSSEEREEIDESGHTYATFGLRFIAFVIDFSILFFITSFFWALLNLPIPSDSKLLFSGKFYLFQNPYGIIIGWLYYAIFECSRFQATPGKAIMQLKVTNDRYEQIDFGKATGRFFGKFISIIIMGIGFIMITSTKRKQGLHDEMAHTYVLKEGVKGIKRKTPSWIILSSSVLLFTISIFIPANTKLIQKGKLSSFRNENSISTNGTPTTSLASYAGITFKYPSNYTISKKEMQKDLAYQLVA